MSKTALEKIVSHLEGTWYLELLVTLAAGVSLYLISNIKIKSKEKELSRLYLQAVLVLFIGGALVFGFVPGPPSVRNTINEYVNVGFNMVEAYVFLSLLSRFTESFKRKKQIRNLLYINISLTLIGLLTTLTLQTFHQTYRLNMFLNVVHFYMIIIAGIWHFYELFQRNRPISVFQLIIVLPMISYCLISVPFFALLEFTLVSDVSNILFAMHYTFLSVLCMSFFVGIKYMEKPHSPLAF